MERMKRFLALLLAVTMIFNNSSFTVLADTVGVVSQNDQQTPDQNANEKAEKDGQAELPEETQSDEQVKRAVTFRTDGHATVFVDGAVADPTGYAVVSKEDAANGVGAVINFTVVPESGYEVVSVIVDASKDARTTESGSYIIEGIQTDNTTVDVTTKAVEAESEQETEAESGMPEYHHSETVNGTVVKIDAPEGAFPEGVTVEIKPSSSEVVALATAQAEEAISDDQQVVGVISFNITFRDQDGNEIEPAKAIGVSYESAVISAETTEALVYHVDENQNVESVTSQENPEGAVGFTADEFSDYPMLLIGDAATLADTPTNSAANPIEIEPGATYKVEYSSGSKSSNWKINQTNSWVSFTDKQKKYCTIKVDKNTPAGTTFSVSYSTSKYWYFKVVAGEPSITVTPTTASLSYIGETTPLTATTENVDAESTITWESSDTNVATVNNGVVTAVGEGTATITATVHPEDDDLSENTYSDTSEVTVTFESYPIYYYALIPNVDISSTINNDQKWYGIGVGKIKGVQNPASLPKKTDITQFELDEANASVALYPDLTYDNVTYQYAAPGSGLEDEYGYYTLQFHNVMIDDGANRGNNKYNTYVATGKNTYHINFTCQINDRVNYTVQFAVQQPGSTSWDYIPKYARRVKDDTPESDTWKPLATDVPDSKTVNGITYKLDGWYKDQNCTNKANFDGRINANTTYYAKYVPTNARYTIEYYYDGNRDDNKTETVGPVNINTQITQSNIQTNINNNVKTGYTFSRVDTLPLTIGANSANNVIKVYYGKRTDLSYTVNYYWLDKSSSTHNTVKVADSITVGGKTFGDSVTRGPIPIEGYTPVSKNSITINIASSGNVIDFYYYKNVTLTAENKTVVYDGTEQSVSQYKVSYIENDEEIILKNLTFQDVSVGAKGTDAGNYPANFDTKVKGKVDQSDTYIVAAYKNGCLTINKRAVTLTSATAEKVYDGTALKNDTVTVGGDGFVTGEGADYDVTGSQTDAGYSNNTFTYTLKQNTKAGNYEITPVTGVLTVKKGATSIVITAASDEKQYDGTPLTNGSYTYTADVLAAGDVLTATVEGSRTDAGTGKNVVTSYQVKRGERDVTGNYNFGESIKGSLTVTKRNVTLTSATAEKVYDGTALKNDTVTVGGDGFVTGEGADCEVTGSQTDAGYSNNTFTYTLKQNTKAGNYEITPVTGVLTVTKRSVTLTSATAEKVYDGTALKNDTVTVGGDGFVTGEGADYDVTGSQTDAGYSNNTFTYTLKQNTKAGNYEITPVTGVLTVKKGATSIVITAASDEKQYDGTPLTNGSYTYTADVLAAGDVLTATVEGSRTDAGTGKNVVTSYQVKRGEKDVTGNYNFGESIKGSLTVTKRNVTLTSATAEKVYDGTALKNDTVTVGGDGFVTGEGADYDVTGSQTDAGYSNNTFTYTLKQNTKAGNYEITPVTGVLTVTKRNVTLTSATAEKVYDGTALKNDTVIVGGDGFVTGEGADYDVTGSQTDAGYSNNTFTYTLKQNTKAGNYEITPVAGVLTVTKRNVTLTSATAEKVYDGTALKNDTVTVGGDGFVTGEGADYDVTGSQTDAGYSDNTFTYTLKQNTKAGNYEITPVTGVLTVTKGATSIVITAASDEKQYDGTPLTNGSYTYTADVLAAGDVLTATVEGSRTDAGTGKNVVTSYQVKRGEKDVTGNYNFGESVKGSLTVTKRNVTLTSATAEKVYDGTALKNNTVTVGGDGFVTGEGADYDVTGSQTDAGYSNNTFTYTLKQNTKAGNYEITPVTGVLTVTKRNVTLTSATAEKVYDGTALKNDTVTVGGDGFVTGEGADYDVTGSQTDAGYSNNTFTYTLKQNTKAGNYEITPVTGVLTVTKRNVTLTSATAEKVYDGTALKNDTVTVGGDGFVTGEGADYDVTGGQTDAGYSDNTFTYTLKQNTKAGNYEITPVTGSLTVTKRNVTLTSATAEKVYDGTALKNDTVTVGGDGFVTGEGADYDVTGSQTDAGYSDNTFTYTLKQNTKAGNYEITPVTGVLTVTKGATSIVITAASDEKQYDGTPLTNGSYTYTADVLAAGDVLTATVEGSRTDAGTGKNVVTSYQVKRGEKDVTGNYNFGESVKGSLTVTKRNVTLTSATAEKVYDGTALKNNTVTVGGDGFVTGEGADCEVTGSQTDAGYSNNTFTYTLKQNTKAGNYEITPVTGVLTVTKRNVTLTSATAEKVYDGTALKNNTVTVGGDGFVTGEGADCEVTGSQTDAGYSNNTFTYTLKQNTKAGNYEITPVTGVLTVTKRNVTLTSATAEKVYDGTALKNDTVTVGGDGFVTGEGADYDVTGSQTDAGYSNNTFTYTLKQNTKAGNYEITPVTGVLTVTKRNVTLTSATAEKVYDGTALKNDTVTVGGDGFVTGEGADCDVTGSQTDAGYSNNTFTYTLKQNTKAGNYEITPVTGSLTVTKRNVTLTSATAEKVYDGTALKNDTVTVGGDGFVTGEGADYDVTGSQTDAGYSDNTFTYTLKQNTKAGNYEITPVTGVLTVTKGATSIVITAASDEKQYDGTPLTNGSYTYTADVLAAGDVLTATVEGSRTDAGTGKNVVTSYQVKRGEKDVTGNYNFGESVKGSLTVTKRNVTLTSATAEMVYDGTALKNDTVTVGGDGFVTGEGADYDVTGSQTDAGYSNNTFTYTLKQNTKAGNYEITPVTGVLTVTKGATSIVITAASDEKQYDGTPLTNGSYTYTADVLAAGDVLTATVEGSRTDAGTGKNVVTSYQVKRGEKDVTGNYNFGESVKGSLTVTKRNVTLTSATAEKVYDGTALKNNTVTVGGDGFVTGEGADCEVTGSQTDAGYSNNTFTYTLKQNTKAGNYEITPVTGVLTVTKRNVTLTSATAEKVYDGTALKNDTVTVGGDGFVTGEGADYDVTGGQTDAGYSDNTFTYTLKQNTKAGNYEITPVTGVLTVTKGATSIVITAASDEKQYDGTPLTNGSYTYTADVLAAGDVLTATVEGSRTDAGTGKNVVTSYQVKRGEKDVTGNYNFGESVKGSLTVTKRNVTLTSATAEKVYDGTALKNNTVTVGGDGFVTGEGADCEVTGSQTDAGYSNNTFTYTLKQNTKAGNYEITPVTGVLTVTKRNVTLTSATAEKVYDGTALKNDTVTVGGDGFVTGEGADYDVTGSQTDAGYSNNTFTYTLKQNTKAGNYEITPVTGVLTVTKRNVTLTSATAEKVYDGTALKNDTVTVGGDGFVTGEGADYDVTGSQTDAGYSNNTFTYTLKQNTKAGNYEITPVAGVLTVTKDATPIIITAASDEKQYDGTPLTNRSYTYTADVLAAGDVLTATVEGSRTDAGTGENVVTGYQVKRDGKDVTGNYNFGESVAGKLKVTPAPLTIKANDREAKYTGELIGALDNNQYSVTEGELAAGESLTVDAITGGKVLVGEYADELKVEGIHIYRGALSLKMKAKAKANPILEDVTDNYSITPAAGKLTITGNPVEAEKTTPEVESNYKAGAKIPFTITVTSTSKDVVENITVTDENAILVKGEGYTLTDAHTAVIASLASEGVVKVNAEHEVTEADILNATVGNTATVTVGDKKITAETGTDKIEDPNPHLTVTKTVVQEDPEKTIYKLGEVITYNITVANDGNVTIKNVVITDDLTGDRIEAGELTPGQTSDPYQVTYTVTEADVLAGKVLNVATATGDNDTDTPTDDTPGEVEVPVEKEGASLSVIKETVDKKAEYALGETISYQINVTNNGDLTVTDIKVKDELAGVQIAAGTGYTVNEDQTVSIEKLAPSETIAISATYTVTEADVQNGKVTNAATASGTSEDPDKKDPTDEGETTDKVEDPNPALTVAKTVTSTPKNGEKYALGESIDYTVTVTNTGNLTVKDIQMTDAITRWNETTIVPSGLTDDMKNIGSLAPGETRKISYSHVVTEEDLGGTLTNAATVTGTSENPDPKEEPTPVNPDPGKTEVTTEDSEDCSITVTKTMTDLFSGEPVAFGFEESFRIALFSGAEMTADQLVGAQVITFPAQTTEANVSFVDLKPGTYYVAEVDGSNTPITTSVEKDNGVYMPKYDTAQSVVVTTDNKTAEFSFTNGWATLPEQQLYVAKKITIIKELYASDGKLDTSANATFFAGVFTDSDHKAFSDVVSQSVVPLKIENGKAQYSIEVSVPQDGSDITLYIDELQNGSGATTLMSEKDGYTHKGQQLLTLNSQSEDQTITLQNYAVKDNTGNSSETEKKVESENKDNNGNNGSIGKTGDVKTGDETPIIPYVVLLFAAAAVLVIETERRRRKNNKAE